jgi:Spy/CpxP family protein refolding chaperone
MKTRIVSLLALASLILAFAFMAAAPNKAGVPATPAAMRRAKEHMEHAAHDFGGHRVAAIEATNKAIQQLEVCLKYDKD